MMSEELKPCPFCGGSNITEEASFSVVFCADCGGEARAQIEVYGTWVRVYCVACGLATMSVPTRNFDPTPATVLWNKRVENDKPA